MSGDRRPGGQLRFDIRKLGFVGKLALPEQKGGLFKRGIFNQIGDLIAAINQPPGYAVDETDLTGRRDDSFKSRVFDWRRNSLTHDTPIKKCDGSAGL